MPFTPGTLLKKRYKIVRTLGRGGQGAVYLCEDMDVYKQKRAIKQLLNVKDMSREEKNLALKMFEKEGAFLSHLDHPGLPKISDKFNQDGRCYIVIDFVQGNNLEILLKNNPGFFTEEKVIEIALQLCDILDYMHTRNPPIVFRDVKPENIILTSDEKVKLIDFGTARLYDKRKKTDTIQVGTVGYAAPEQYTGQTDPRADIYAFGALLHHLLTELDPKHLTPFEAEKIPIRSVKAALSKHMESVIARALVSSRNKRYKSVAEMKIDLLKSSLLQVCNTCGAIFPSRVRFCKKCGTRSLADKSSPKEKYVFSLEPGGSPGRNMVFLDKDVLQIGRADTNDIKIKDHTISGMHALLERRRNTFVISDLDSTNGTFVNGKKIKSKKMKPDCQVRLGQVILYFRKKKK